MCIFLRSAYFLYLVRYFTRQLCDWHNSPIDIRFKLWQKGKADMTHWKVNAASLIILGGLVFLMLLIVVLPDVDLPDTAFHRGTAPVVVHAQFTAAPTAATVIAAVLHLPDAADISRSHYQPGALTLSPRPNSIPILLRSIRR
jgi:succinate dehydrogenase hydrophobic anchor subunit